MAKHIITLLASWRSVGSVWQVRQSCDAVATWLRTPVGGLFSLCMVAVVCGVFVERFVLALAVACAAVLLVGVIWPRLTIRGLRAELAFSAQQASEATPVDVCLIVRNYWPLPAWGVEVTGLADYAPQASIRLPVVRPWCTEQFRWQFVPECRGVYPSSELSLLCSVPFRLTASRRLVAVQERLSVAPRIGHVRKQELLIAAQGLWQDHAQTVANGHSELGGVRYYRLGDSMRDIHWPLTAKHQKLIVSERHDHAQPQVVVHVDLTPHIHVGSAPDGSLEWSLRIAASLCQSVMHSGGEVHCVLGDQCFSVSGGERDWAQWLRSLGELPRAGLMASLAYEGRAHRNATQIRITTDRATVGSAQQRPALEYVLITQGFFGGYPVSAAWGDEQGSTAPARGSRQILIHSPQQAAALLYAATTLSREAA